MTKEVQGGPNESEAKVQLSIDNVCLEFGTIDGVCTYGYGTASNYTMNDVSKW